MNKANASLCADFLSRTNLARPFESPLLSYPYNARFAHPVVFTSRLEVEHTFLDWVQSEANSQ